ncbi:hypothetical protein Salat_0864100 [Sesamum alatum]|uniref:Uncharacterized protein n=1 Tax=Sesamum alatum TaxID=300844 RepID=A0AAE1YIU1_9LAMI|nr:hypothetical protein Salat_0864100 [Sesamum alatum]
MFSSPEELSEWAVVEVQLSLNQLAVASFPSEADCLKWRWSDERSPTSELATKVRLCDAHKQVAHAAAWAEQSGIYFSGKGLLGVGNGVEASIWAEACGGGERQCV